MSINLPALLHHADRQRRMLADSDLTRDCLLFALAMDELLFERRAAPERGGPRSSGNRWIAEIEEMVLGFVHEDHRGVWVQRVIADDVPRYEPLRQGTVTPCAAPRARGGGLCGKASSLVFVDREPTTGSASWRGLCRRHRELRATFTARLQAWRDNGSPMPPPNKGGILPKYFNADWDSLYKWAAPYLTPLKTGAPTTPARPQLQLLSGGQALEPRS